MKGNKAIIWIVTVVLVGIFVYSLFFSTPTYKVTFDSNGGTAVSSLKVKKNETVTAPTEPTREGYTFKEWQVNGTTYQFNTPVTGNITVTAVWEETAKTTTTTKKTKKTTTKKTTTAKKTTTKKTTTTTKKAN